MKLKPGDVFSLSLHGTEYTIDMIEDKVVYFSIAESTGKVNLEFFKRLYKNGKVYDLKTMKKIRKKNVV